MNKLVIIVSMTAGLALQPVANAAQSWPVPPVSISANGFPIVATGSISAAAASSNPTVSIGCETAINGTTPFIICSANDGAGLSASCTLVNPPTAWLQIVSAINSSSAINFNYNSNGVCSSLWVTNASGNL
jgi:hypothetical protein